MAYHISPVPDLSIIIVNWNTLQMLREVLQSTYDTLTGISAEVIVIDNASTDGSPDMVAAEFPQARLIRNSGNRGFAAANNQGFRVATGRHLLLLNSDTIVLGDVLAASVRYLDAHPRVGAMGCRVLNTDGTMQRTCSMFPSLTNLVLLTSGLWKLGGPAPLRRVFGRYQMTDWARDSEREVEVISGCYLMLRRKVLEQVGDLDEEFFFFGEETDWCHRMRSDGWSLRFAPVGEIIHHGGGSARRLNHARDLMLTDAMIRLQRKHGGPWAAGAARGILLGFNLSRAVFWTLRSLLQPGARTRASHFRAITKGILLGADGR